MFSETTYPQPTTGALPQQKTPPDTVGAFTWQSSELRPVSAVVNDAISSAIVWNYAWVHTDLRLTSLWQQLTATFGTVMDIQLVITHNKQHR